MKYTLEDDVRDWVKEQFHKINFKKNKDYNVESVMSERLKKSLIGSSKTQNINHTSGKPDFTIEKYDIPIIIECKLGVDKLINLDNNGNITSNQKSIETYAVNQCINYAVHMIGNGLYDEVIAIGIAGSSKENVKIDVNYVYGYDYQTVKRMNNYKTLDFIENEQSFNSFVNNCKLTKYEKNEILADFIKILDKTGKKLNTIMNNLNFNADERSLLLSGMILSMQDIYIGGDHKLSGLTPNDLKGTQLKNQQDGTIIFNQIDDYLSTKNVEQVKKEFLIARFHSIFSDTTKNKKVEIDTNLLKPKLPLNSQESSYKQIFTYIYHNIFLKIDLLPQNIDIIGQMYTMFLKYSLGDGKTQGIVLTPPYVTKLMGELIEIDENSKVLDLCMGTGGFLISAMDLMIDCANKKYGAKTTKAKNKIEKIKSSQLFGVEIEPKMYTLASTNMILRGDGSSCLEIGDAFEEDIQKALEKYKATHLMLNPPYNDNKFKNYGLEFVELGLSKMKKGSKGIIITSSSAGQNENQTAKNILSKHTLIASIKMPNDLFKNADISVPTSIYVFSAKEPHNFNKTVRFIDFSNDGYKRTKRYTQSLDFPEQRYEDIKKIFNNGVNAKVNKSLWELSNICVDDYITPNSGDWNFESHIKEEELNEEDFEKTIINYMNYELTFGEFSNKGKQQKIHTIKKPKKPKFAKFNISSLFEKEEVKKTKYKVSTCFKMKLEDNLIPVLSSQSSNNGICGYLPIELVTPLENMLSIGSNGECMCFYQKHKFSILQDCFAIKFKEKINEKIYLYLAATINHLLKRNNWNNKINWNKLKDKEIYLPITNNKKIDYQFMEDYITYLENNIIKKQLEDNNLEISKMIEISNR